MFSRFDKYILVLIFFSALYFFGQPHEPEDSRPKDEKEFISIVKESINSNDEANDLQREDVRNLRDEKICKSLPKNHHIQNWQGTVENIGSTLKDNATLEVKLPYNISIETYNNALSDINEKTTIPKNSQLYKQIYDLHKGDVVTFSGEFIPYKNTCASELSLTLYGGLSEPSFLFRFDSISKTSNEK